MLKNRFIEAKNL